MKTIRKSKLVKVCDAKRRTLGIDGMFLEAAGGLRWTPTP